MRERLPTILRTWDHALLSFHSKKWPWLYFQTSWRTREGHRKMSVQEIECYHGCGRPEWERVVSLPYISRDLITHIVIISPNINHNIVPVIQCFVFNKTCNLVNRNSPRRRVHGWVGIPPPQKWLGSCLALLSRRPWFQCIDLIRGSSWKRQISYTALNVKVEINIPTQSLASKLGLGRWGRVAIQEKRLDSALWTAGSVVQYFAGASSVWKYMLMSPNVFTNTISKSVLVPLPDIQSYSVPASPASVSSPL